MLRGKVRILFFSPEGEGPTEEGKFKVKRLVEKGEIHKDGQDEEGEVSRLMKEDLFPSFSSQVMQSVMSKVGFSENLFSYLSSTSTTALEMRERMVDDVCTLKIKLRRREEEIQVNKLRLS